MIHVFHGFLGSPGDFSFLEGDGVILHDLYQGKWKGVSLGPEDVLIGYSMGGRIALELAVHHGFRIKRLVLINAHPGLQTEPERDSRRLWEDEVLRRMDGEDFLNFWNSLPVFSADSALEQIPEEKLSLSRKLFDEMRLSSQPNFLPELRGHREKVLFLVGGQDEKYMELAREKLLPNEVPVKIVPGGHRLFQNPGGIRRILSQEDIIP